MAKMAKVSRGTVDRVLHNRGKVSEDALIRVNEVLEKINYHPNLIARSLKNSKDYYVAVLMPDYQSDAYWKTCYKGIKDAAKEFKSYGVSIDLYFFTMSEAGSFMESFEKILEANPDGLVLVPAFSQEAKEVYQVCDQRSIVYSTFNTPPEEGVEATFVGQDMVQSGRLGAELLHLLDKDASKFLIVHINDEEFENAIHLQKKEKGFRAYLSERSDIEILRLSIQHSDLQDQQAEIRKFLKGDSNISGIWVSSSKAFAVAEVLRDLKLKTSLVGYDLIEENTRFLEDGNIDFLINQNPRSQAFFSVAHVAEKLAFQKEMPEEHLLPIDIVSRENLIFYLNNKRNRTKLLI
ncbi:MAG: substrate-binding domain-containing protein [Bacteroidota bacterium]